VFRNALFSLAALVSISTLSAAQGTQNTAPGTDVPVRTVVLFSSGVGYFEHAGTVLGNGSTELRFQTGQINDILKSLVLQDQDGGRVTTITYPSQDPLSKTLKSFQVDITGNPSMAELLNQLRGARVTIQAQAERISGIILGVEFRRVAVEKGEAVERPVLNILTGAMIRAIELQSVTTLSLDDAALQDELTKALAALSQARDQDKKPVQINFAGTGERRVRIGYVVETPIWKTSYRLLLDDRSSRLQGWAIVENQTESDWNNISLSLVSGRPISFTMDLYQPLYAERPLVVQELLAGMRPQVYEGGTDAARDRVVMAPSAPVQTGAGGRGGGGRAGANGAPQGQLQSSMSDLFAKTAKNEEALDANASVQSIAQTAKLGELFQYSVGNVTLARQKSAMLPIITDSIAVERVSIYNPGVLQRNPLNGVILKNITDKHLLQGPITVLDKNSYAGDARIDNVPPGQERLLSYGVDLEMLVDATKNTQVSSVVTAKINKGALLIDRKLVATREYAADNKTSRDKTIIIEHPLRMGWKLIEPARPYESTETLYRFKGTAMANKVTTLSVREELVRTESIAMVPADVQQLISYSRTGEIPQAVRDALARAIQLKQNIIVLEAQISAKTSQVGAITEEQNRIRENMKTVASTTQYYQRLLEKLNEQESAIEKLQTERDALVARRNVLRNELSDYLNSLTIG
jgi:hypothetical protein